MRTRIILTALLVILCSELSLAQAPIVRQNGSVLGFYNTVPAAIAAAANGDTLYIPGGSWTLGTSAYFTISKSLHLIGVGHNPDSSQGSGLTFLATNSLAFTSGASNGSITGVYLQNSLVANITANDTVTNYKINRCRIGGSLSFSNNCAGWMVSESVLDGIVSQVTGNSIFTNSIFGNRLFLASNAYFKNNIFLGSGGPSSYVLGSQTISNVVFDNNIFMTQAYTIYPPAVTACIFNNNLFGESILFPYGTNLGSNNFVNQASTSILINQTGNFFNYSHNYHLQITSPGHNAGTDNTDVGIYGGQFPWKEGSLPSNPHVQFKSIQGNTDQNGDLQINIKVKAQNN